MMRPIFNGFLMVLFFAVFAWLLAGTDWGAAEAPSGISPERIGENLFTTYGAAFEVLSLLLLATLVGAVYLVMRPGEGSD